MQPGSDGGCFLNSLAYLDPVLKTIPQVKPVEIGVFAGAMNYNNLSWLNKKIIISKGLPEGDFRDWEAIRAWVGGPVFMKFKVKKIVRPATIACHR